MKIGSQHRIVFDENNANLLVGFRPCLILLGLRKLVSPELSSTVAKRLFACTSNEASPQTHEHVMLVPKLRTTRHLRRTQAPTFMRYMNRAPRGIRHPDIGTEPYKATTALWDSASSACNPVRRAQSHTRTREGMCALFQKPDSFTTTFDPQAF